MNSSGFGHNQGPPLVDYEGPPWGDGDPYVFFCWVRAAKRAWKDIPAEVALRRAERAEALGLTYEEYTLEILERGRHLQGSDTARDGDQTRAARRRRLNGIRWSRRALRPPPVNPQRTHVLCGPISLTNYKAC